MAFKVSAQNFEQSFERWIDALEMAKSLIPSCKGLFGQVKVLEDGKLVWAYDRFHRYPQFFGAGTYKRLARRFVLETMEDEASGDRSEP
ncbi:hypothetical protein [Altericista sp. CCNU0014]|uniref:hypothetical protein n=1 Tax=Altericista sp. CCNU0014 TaxID=3082949 RepID=UPI00384F9B43